MKKVVWIDLDNSPHVPLFVPLIESYRAAGVEVVVTARDHAQTIELLENAGLGGSFAVIGRHYGKNKLNKIRGLVARAAALARFARRLAKNGPRVAVAVSHGSRSMVLAARWLGIPVISMYDYEFTETLIFNRFSDEVIVPDGIPDATLDAIKLPAAKRVKYPGLKEELYLNYYRPDPDFRAKFAAAHDLALAPETILVALRPPATTANYHDAASEKLLAELLRRLLGDARVFTVILPRTGEQRAEVARLIGALGLDAARALVLARAVDGLALAAAADLLVSGGGTMNREAVLLGTPVYSIFAGRQGALDRAMEERGEIAFVRSAADVAKIRLAKKSPAAARPLTDRVERVVRARIDRRLEAGAGV